MELDSTQQAMETIDAAFFSGDYFDDKEALQEIIILMDRWKRRVEEIKEVQPWNCMTCEGCEEYSKEVELKDNSKFQCSPCYSLWFERGRK